MDEEPMNKGVDKSGESFVKDHGFAAVPIHFNPKDGAEKKIALVIPGIEPPLAFFRVAGSTPDDLTFEEIDGNVASVSQAGADEEIKTDVDQDTVDELPTSEPDTEDGDVTEDENEDLESEDESEDSEEISYPYEDESGNPCAGFLLGNDDVQPLVVVVKPQDGETAEDALSRVGEQHSEHIPGTLEEATKLLGHSPLTSGDN
jgi:hypothetical protein